MSKSLLCLVAFTCLVSMVMAQYTYITQSYYTDSACATTPSHSIFNSTDVATRGVTFSGYNCDTTGRAFSVQYSDATSFTAYSYLQLGAMACQPSGTGFVTYNCSVTSSTTAKPAPISFPASSDGWITSQTWYLASNGNIADKCNSETAKTYILNSATHSGVCSAYGTKSTTTPAGYSMSFCSSNSAYEGAAMFDVADTTCVNEPLKFAVGPTGRCDGGTISTCDAGSASLFPSSMPSIGSVNYDQADTTCALPFIGAALFMESKCVTDGYGNSEMFLCSSQFVNKTIPAGTWSQWSGNTACTGTASKTVTQIAQDFDPSNAAPSNCQNTQSFTCHFEFPAAASTITISFCTMIVAIFVALFGKQL